MKNKEKLLYLANLTSSIVECKSTLEKSKQSYITMQKTFTNAMETFSRQINDMEAVADRLAKELAND
tara:strand:+ start:179 stop:379 length:201 start_codon:yes stop_codon:yes gene_type:complete